jgi:CBS domain-containing membrane protein
VITVGDLMTRHLFTLPDTASVWEARRLMAQHHVRHIPVVNADNDFVGLLTQRDVLATGVSVLADVDASEIQALESSIPVREVMTLTVMAVEEGSDLREAAQYMLEHKIGCLPVVNQKGLVGIITETDFLKLVLRLLDRLDD